MKKLDMFYMKVTLALSVFFGEMLYPGLCFAQSVGYGTTLSGQQDMGSLTFPWTKFLNSLVKEVTGPFPITVGIICLAGAAFMMFMGNGGGFTQKLMIILFGVSIALFAPTLIGYVQTSAGGATVYDVMGTAAAASRIGVLP